MWRASRSPEAPLDKRVDVAGDSRPLLRRLLQQLVVEALVNDELRLRAASAAAYTWALEDGVEARRAGRVGELVCPSVHEQNGEGAGARRMGFLGGGLVSRLFGHPTRRGGHDPPAAARGGLDHGVAQLQGLVAGSVANVPLKVKVVLGDDFPPPRVSGGHRLVDGAVRRARGDALHAPAEAPGKRPAVQRDAVEALQIKRRSRAGAGPRCQAHEDHGRGDKREGLTGQGRLTKLVGHLKGDQRPHGVAEDDDGRHLIFRVGRRFVSHQLLTFGDDPPPAGWADVSRRRLVTRCFAVARVVKRMHDHAARHEPFSEVRVAPRVFMHSVVQENQSLRGLTLRRG
eukprot:CAMPEP_0172604632 /NCGR_PEP_ID=MMETSP1068-20121228/24891_1 /TAXON_ID=35684 /ORGANISM="Pseudopedinella elastica, Strain CCMP716" /LENGTH=342 /DNA_ID=CAMNT_0013406771 /DNA_START=224 /DNA_END=1249 /DNA_ORIENTATION=-